MKRVALCFRGKHKEFEESYENIREFIIDDLRTKYEVDIFILTYQTELTDKIISLLQPVSTKIYNDAMFMSKNAMGFIIPTQCIDACKMVIESEEKNSVKYDYVIITRFDLTFNNRFFEYDIDYSKINMECMFVPDYNSGDNFFLFDRSKFTDIFIQSNEEVMKRSDISHQLFKYILMAGYECHYIGGNTNKRATAYDVMFRFTRHIEHLFQKTADPF